MTQQDSITLYLTETRAHAAAEQENDFRINTGLTLAGYSIIAATMRDHDGSVDHGFKAQMRPHGGEPVYFL